MGEVKLAGYCLGQNPIAALFERDDFDVMIAVKRLNMTKNDGFRLVWRNHDRPEKQSFDYPTGQFCSQFSKKSLLIATQV